MPAVNQSTPKVSTRRDVARPRLTLVTPPPVPPEPPRRHANADTHELRLTFRELTLIYKSLQSTRTLAVLPAQDGLLDDTIQLVDHVLNKAV